jgi:prevent-host-death family protein
MRHFVYVILNNQLALFIIGCLLTIAPAIGIMVVHSSKNEDNGV